MTCYHVSGSLYLKAANEKEAADIHTAVSVLAADTGKTGKTFTNVRNFNVSKKDAIAKDGTQHLQISLRFKTQEELDKAVDQLLTDIKDRVNEEYYSTLEYHICHHDEGVGSMPPEKQTVMEWGSNADTKPIKVK